MSINDSPGSSEPRPEASKKKPYQKPVFRYEQVFVTSALSCGKTVGGSEGGCGTNSSAS
jgi:hypothetical protein